MEELFKDLKKKDPILPAGGILDQPALEERPAAAIESPMVKALKGKAAEGNKFAAEVLADREKRKAKAPVEEAAATGERKALAGVGPVVVQEKKKPGGLYQKILAVMHDIEYLRKDLDVEITSKTGSKFAYSAISEEKVLKGVRSHFVKHGLIIIPEKVDVSNFPERFLTQAVVTYRIIDTETHESFLMQSLGQGVDTQDKGAGKALTYAFKALILKLLMLPTGDDPDKVASEVIEEYTAQDEQYNKLVKDIKFLYGELRYTVATAIAKNTKILGTNKYKDAEPEDLDRLREELQGELEKQNEEGRG